MKSFLISLVILAVAFPSRAQNVGEIAPAFSYPALGGGEITLADYSNKVVFVFLFGNTCPFCLAIGSQTEVQVNAVHSSNPSFQAVGLDLWTSSSTTASVTSFRNRTSINYPLGLQAGSMASLYGTTYDRLLVIGADGILRYKGTSNVSSTLLAAKTVVDDLLATIALGTDDSPESEASFLQPFPNPSAGRASISYQVGRSEQVRLSVFDMLGREVSVLEERFRPVGLHTTEWRAEARLPSGLYFLVLESARERIVRTVLLSR